MKKYLDILTAVLQGKYTTPKYEIQSTNGEIDFVIKLIDGKINIIFGQNKPIAVGKFILRIKLPINSIVFDGDYMYVKPDGWTSIPVNLKDLENT